MFAKISQFKDPYLFQSITENNERTEIDNMEGRY